MSRYRDTQLQVTETVCDLWKYISVLKLKAYFTFSNWLSWLYKCREKNRISSVVNDSALRVKYCLECRMLRFITTTGARLMLGRLRRRSANISPAPAQMLQQKENDHRYLPQLHHLHQYILHPGQMACLEWLREETHTWSSAGRPLYWVDHLWTDPHKPYQKHGTAYLDHWNNHLSIDPENIWRIIC